ncbi:hypothetical protein D9757_003448 [Collybiopsis confluens]|uniref:Endonuclease/exonuclease/phosphatase domain-containing protein n=1 Tax=Collybiopsis confluens TaxID=2823264 RepID=A0A8H5HTN9_9AGAR|nr:hypothetical protein D9757_003448 [Collybiopsis confluens]
MLFKSFLLALAYAAALNAAPILRREVPQEHSHEAILILMREAIATGSNPQNLGDPVFGLLGDAAAAGGLGQTADPECLQQNLADLAFTNAKASSNVTLMTAALIYRALERNTGSVGLQSNACTSTTAVNPEVAAISQHQDPASTGAAATNKAVVLALAQQIASIGGNPQDALQSGTFAPGTIGDPTAKGNTCDNIVDVGCIVADNLLVEDATADEINAAVGSSGSSATGSNDAASSASTLISSDGCTTEVTVTSTVTAAAQAPNSSSSTCVAPVTVTVTADSEATPSAVSRTTSAASAATTTSATTGQNLQTFTGDLGGSLPPAVTTGGKGFVVDGVTTLVTDVQGIAFQSPFAGKTVSNVTGVVTAKASDGFYISGPASSDVRASNGLFIFSETASILSKVAVGDMVSITGTVSEFRSSSSPNDLTSTEITSPTAANVVVLATGDTVTPVKLGTDRVPPTQALSALDVGPDGWLSVPNNQSQIDTVNATLVPTQFGLDFWASLEGQLVTVPSAQSIAFPNSFGEFWVIGSWPVTGLNSRGGLTITIGPDNIPDANPEAVIVGAPLDGTTNPVVSVGVKLSDITGVIQYQFGFYYILPLTAPKVLSTPAASAPITNITADITDICIVTFGDYNVDNFSPTSTQLPLVASHIANNMLHPDIVFLQEIQDNDGATDDGVVSSNLTLSNLVTAIASLSGVTYDFVTIDPVNDADGGEPGGNIRQAYLYRSQKIQLVAGSPAGTATDTIAVSSSASVPKLNFNPGRIAPSNAAWVDSRKPLVAEWQTNGGATLFTVNLHLESKDGSGSTGGNARPPVNSPVAKRTTQVQLVTDFVQSVLDIDSEANVLVAGDCNEYLETRSVFASLTNIMEEMDVLSAVAPVERYTYVFDQNCEQLDHAFVSPALSQRQHAIEHVHVNNWVSNINNRASDHDPSVGKVRLC